MQINEIDCNIVEIEYRYYELHAKRIIALKKKLNSIFYSTIAARFIAPINSNFIAHNHKAF